MDAYPDPLWRDLERLEESIESWIDPAAGFHPDPDAGLDQVGRMLGALEADIEQPPPPAPRPIEPEPDTPSFNVESYVYRNYARRSGSPSTEPDTTPGLPGDDVSSHHYSIPHGTRPPTYRSHGRAGAGIRHQGTTQRWCVEAGGFVDEDACATCPYWGNHGNGYDECWHDWLAESQHEGEVNDADAEPA